MSDRVIKTIIESGSKTAPAWAPKKVVDLSMSVLIVDDHKTMLKILCGLMRQVGFTNVEEAGSGQIALEKLRSKKYGLILSDWNMEEMTGLDLLKTVRWEQSLKHIPFIMVTAESLVDNVAAAKAAGANNYLVKPFTAERLKQVVVSVLGDF